MSITYKLNAEKNGVEIKFTEKPSEKVRAKLKALGFRWSQFNGVWYAKQSEETIAYAKELASEEGEQISLNIPTEEVEEQEEEKPIEEVIKEATRKVVERTEKKAIDPQPTPKKAEPKAEPKKAEKKEASKTPTKAEAPKKDNIVVFPSKERPRVNKAITEGFHTYEECVEKFNAENEKVFGGGYDRYVIKALLDMCGVSQNFRNNVMKADKSLLGSVEYFEEMAKKGYAYAHNNTRFFNADLEIAFAIDYFNSAEGLDSIVGQAEKEVGI